MTLNSKLSLDDVNTCEGLPKASDELLLRLELAIISCTSTATMFRVGRRPPISPVKHLILRASKLVQFQMKWPWFSQRCD